jgi:hypothetical protein
MATLPSATRIVASFELQPTTKRATTRNEQQGTPIDTIAKAILV